MQERIKGTRIQTLRCAAAALLGVTSVVTLGWGLRPPRHEILRTSIEADDVRAQMPSPVTASGEEAVAGTWHLVMEYTPLVRVSDEAVVRLQVDLGEQTAASTSAEALTVPEENVPSQDFAVGTARTVIVQALMELPGQSVRPPEEISQVLSPGEPVQFAWRVTPRHRGSADGTIWLFVVNSGEGPDVAERIAVLAKSIHISARDLMGLDGVEARILGALSAVCLALWLVFSAASTW